MPVSVAGSGRSISDRTTPQIPFVGANKADYGTNGVAYGANETAYYFLKEANPWANPWRPATEPASFGQTRPPFDVDAIKKDFPILSESVNGRPLIWLDNAATTQKPWAVIDRISYFYSHENSNIHRAAHELAARATDAYEGARKKVQQFINGTISCAVR